METGRGRRVEGLGPGDAGGAQGAAEAAAPCVWTWTGRRVSLVDPRPEQIHVDDLAHALARLPRYSAQTHEIYSVAQHSWEVLDMLGIQERAVTPAHRVWALLHDAHEAYIGDLPRPLSALLDRDGAVSQVKRRLDEAVLAAFRVTPPDEAVRADVKAADDACGEVERGLLFGPYARGHSLAWGRALAERRWRSALHAALRRYHRSSVTKGGA